MDEPQNLNIGKKDTDVKLSSKLGELERKEKEKEAEVQAQTQDLPYINLTKFPISQEALKLISKEQAESLQTICFFYTGEEVRLASLNPTNTQVISLAKELGEKYHANVKIYFISEESFQSAFAIYKRIPVIIEIEGVKITEEDLKKFEDEVTDFNKLNELIQKTSLTETINLVIAAAMKLNSSDIHMEAEQDDVKIRLRIDGVLHNVANMKKEAWEKIDSRIKLLAGLKLNIGNKPQDGRFTINLSKDKVDVRVSTIPSTYGGSIVMRLLRASSVGLDFEELGLKGKAFNDLQEEMLKPNGMVISTGPTGSGKTTTLYAILNKLNKPETKIITLEDPVEYKLSGIIQSQVESADKMEEAEVEAGEKKKTRIYTFARGLKAILRQDPDIVMVGEIRDLETAETAINASLTGHLMLSSLHTNSAAATIPRFLAMGVKDFLLAPSLNAIIGQRLVRKLCPECKEEDKNIDNNTMTDILNALNAIAPESGHKPDNISNAKFYKSKGCKACTGLGYKGRIGIFEVFVIAPEVEKIILSGEISENEIEKVAIKNGMITMLQDGLLKAIEGITSVEEIFKEVKE